MYLLFNTRLLKSTLWRFYIVIVYGIIPVPAMTSHKGGVAITDFITQPFRCPKLLSCDTAVIETWNWHMCVSFGRRDNLHNVKLSVLSSEKFNWKSCKTRVLLHHISFDNWFVLNIPNDKSYKSLMTAPLGCKIKIIFQ